MRGPEDSLFSCRPRGKFLTAYDLAQRFGWRTFLDKIVPWVFVRRYVFCSKSISEPIPESPSAVPLRLELATEKDLPALMALRPHYYELQVLQKRMQEGHLCFLGWSLDSPIHVRWVFVKSLYLPYLHRTLLLSSKQVYFDEAYTSPEFRGRKIFSMAGNRVRLRLWELGYKSEISIFASWQACSQTLAARIECEKVGEAKIVNWLGLRKFYWKGSIQNHGDGKISIFPS
ncbi:MAG: hypothetical protein JXB23_04780 [Candidatus Aminicenantes bacterium]|nr:hypothetical protein [Candidatus Aminicenantes bacterium]